MDPARFYGTAKHVNIIPGDGDISDDDVDSDCDDNCNIGSISLTPKRHIIIPESESDFSEEDDVPLTSIQTATTSKAKGKSVKKKRVIWKEEKMPAYDVYNFQFTGNTDLPDTIKQLDSPADVFRFLFTADIIHFITEQSNLKSIQENINNPAMITTEDIEKFIGIVIFMSCVKLPATRKYWSKEVGQTQVYEIMTCNRFESIKRFLHFNNNENFVPRGQDGHDKLFKNSAFIEYDS
ncbi:unnamed protein product [Danaus chrysippus]|uniref:(African queen) hypothetical protein n=1 Tax=Danaus chrysippus TaxID=151541 RepID=A0A8J2W622_9NEOP|nr:unnamed protein product [Danaus chrysippus]